MKSTVLLTGSSGLLGRHLSAKLEENGMTVRPLSHCDPAWDWEAGTLQPGVLEGINAVIHLAGEPIADKRWSAKQKAKIRDSRVIGTRAMAEALTRVKNGPDTFICASAVGLYGNRGDHILDEESESGEGFLPDVVRDWEAAADPAREAGIRVVHVRLGIVLSADGGALKKMLPPFRLGLGGPLGSGNAWMSWIHLTDAVRAFETVLTRPEYSGAYNGVSPDPQRNLDFSKTLAGVLHRPCLFPVPPFVLRLLLGDMADEALLASTRALPRRLTEAGFSFEHPNLESALNDLLGST